MNRLLKSLGNRFDNQKYSVDDTDENKVEMNERLERAKLIAQVTERRQLNNTTNSTATITAHVNTGLDPFDRRNEHEYFT
jgi:hypothetical protein